MRKHVLGVSAGLALTAALIAGNALAGQGVAPEAVLKAPDIRLSAAEINAFLSEDLRDVPDNCEVFYSPFNGQCMGVVCTSPSGGQTLYECSEFGL